VEVLIDNITRNCLWSSLRQAAYSKLDPTFVPGVVVSFDVCSCRVFKETDRLVLSDNNNGHECQQVEFEYGGVLKQNMQKHILNYCRPTGYWPVPVAARWPRGLRRRSATAFLLRR